MNCFSRYGNMKEGNARMKLLTISIAAYNMEEYIGQCIESLLDARIIDELEIFVIDDGGTDGTLEIAKKYAAQYPNSIVPVHKENGGWGSTVNYALANASGKYFKILDGDDWFDRDGLYELVKVIKEVDADMITTPCHHFQNDSFLYTEYYYGFANGKVQSMNSLNRDTSLVGMWGMTVKTQVARSIGFELPQHKHYTDLIFVQGILMYTRTILYLPFPLYCYRQNRPGQSTSTKSYAKHYREQVYASLRSAELYQEQKRAGSDGVAFACKRAAATQCWAYKSIISLNEPMMVFREIREYDKQLLELSKDVYQSVVLLENKAAKLIRILRRTRFAPVLMLRLIPKRIMRLPIQE